MSRTARRREAGRALALAILAGACARLGSPPGGPTDKLAPQLLATVPESLGRYPGWRHDVEFQFDEVISEGGSPNVGLGTGDLEKLVLLSPTREVPAVSWKRHRITVHPREGWRPDVVYRVELLPGLADLRRNVRDSGTVITFSTGAVLPTDTLRGLVLDWGAGRTAKGALIEAILDPDSLVYRTVTDSAGRFTLGPLPPGAYRVYGTADQNRNLRRDSRESYDSTTVAGGTGGRAVATLWLLPRDTLGPRLQSATATDSLSATLTFTQPLDPLQRFDQLAVRLFRLSDSTALTIRSLLPPAVDDSLERLRRAALDSLRPASDSTPRAGGAAQGKGPRPPGLTAPRRLTAADSILQTRPRLFDRLVLRPETPLAPETRYGIEIVGLRSAAGASATAKGGFVTAKPRPPGQEGRGQQGGQQGDQQGAPPRPRP